MGLMVLGISFVYSHLFEIPLHDFMPFVACGIVFWGVIAGTITEGCDTFVQASGMLSQTSLPMVTFVWRTVLRSLINLGHHVVIILAVLAWYGIWNRANVPLALAGLLLVLLNISWITLAVAIASARFRDIPQIVASITTFAIFLTPVFWKARGALLDHALLNLNPFYHMLDAVRAPLLGQSPSAQTYLTLVGMGVIGWAVTFTAFAFTRRRIVHYL
jgi:ABC-type polysaccharide/polyol phosphate export permease